MLDTVVRTCGDHLREVVHVVVAVRVADVLNVRLVAATWFIDALVALVVNNLIATAIFVVERTDIENTTAQVLEDSEVVQLLHVIKWIEVKLSVIVRVEVCIALHILNVKVGAGAQLGSKQSEDKSLLWLLRAEEFVTIRAEVLLVCEEEQIL